MTTSETLFLPLACHPATPSTVVRTLAVRQTHHADGGLELVFQLQGDIARLRISAPSPRPLRSDRLWEQTCFEIFIAQSGRNAYREFNFAPSGDWAVYAFADYRRPCPDDEARVFAPDFPAPQITAQRSAGRLEVAVNLPPDALPPGNLPLEIGLSAVVEAADLCEGRHSYWALAHATERPDFHRRESFTLRLP